MTIHEQHSAVRAVTEQNPHQPGNMSELMARMETMSAEMSGRGDAGRFFLDAYLGMTKAIARELEKPELGGFADPAWVERWDLAFAETYLDAVVSWEQGGKIPSPWQVAFAAAQDPTLPPLRHMLLGLNAHMNYDLPLSLLAVVTDADFADPQVMARREEDHKHINRVVLIRIGPTDVALSAAKGGKTPWERIKTPLERAATGWFIDQARAKGWANTRLMAAARARGDSAEFDRLKAELASRCSARLEQLKHGRELILQLWIRGFGVRLQGA